MFAALDRQLAYRAVEKGDFDTAVELTEKLPENLRFEALLNLAESILSKSPKDDKKAILILGKAKSLIPAAPSNLSETQSMRRLAAVYALTDPETGFNLLWQAIPKIAEVSGAEIVVKNFRGDSNVRDNEFVINFWFLFSGFSDIQNSLIKMTKIDFERTIKVINVVSRRDLRIALQLDVLENGRESNLK
jgi:hypothetical protein